MDGAAASGAGSESGAGAEVVDVDCIPATDPNTGTLKLLENQMNEAFKQDLIKSIEKQLRKAEAAQKKMESANEYFTDLFKGYKSHLDEKNK